MILDGSPNIIDVHDEIIRELYHAAVREQVEHLVERLEGWWFGTVIKALSASETASIPVLAIDQRVDELREEFKRDALPIDFRTSDPPLAVVAELDGRPFVQQLRKIEIGPTRIEDLLLDGELASYEQTLVEAWQPRHAAALDELTPGCAPKKKAALGQSVFRWVEQDASFPLRSVRERFLTHGSYHILSNQFAVGWHPDFKSDAPTLDEKTEKK